MSAFVGRVMMDGRTIAINFRKIALTASCKFFVEAQLDEGRLLPGFEIIRRNGRWQPIDPLPEWVRGQEYLICSLIDRKKEMGD